MTDQFETLTSSHSPFPPSYPHLRHNSVGRLPSLGPEVEEDNMQGEEILLSSPCKCTAFVVFLLWTTYPFSSFLYNRVMGNKKCCLGVSLRSCGRGDVEQFRIIGPLAWPIPYLVWDRLEQTIAVLLFSSRRLTGATWYCFPDDLFCNFRSRFHVNGRLKIVWDWKTHFNELLDSRSPIIMTN